MAKRIMFILVITIFFCFSFVLGLKAQQRYTDPDEQTALSDFSETLTKIETAMNKLSTSLDNTNKEILKKLDQVLSNQEKIINELEIVKVRASRR